MKHVASIVGFFLVLGLSQLIFTLIWGDSGRLFLLSVLIALSFVLSLSLAREVQTWKKDLKQMGEPDRQALRDEYPEEFEEMTDLMEEVHESHWLLEGLRQFAMEVLEIAGVVAAFLALPVIVSLVKDGGLSLNESWTIWQVALSLLGAAIYGSLRYYWRRADIS